MNSNTGTDDLTRTARSRLVYAALAIFCIGLLGYGYYLEFVVDLVPCPLCIFQRLCYMLIGVIALIATVHGPRHRANRVYALFIALAAILGAAIAARQTWLQHLPPERVPECGPGLEFMLEMYPVLDVIKRALIGSGDCAVVEWRFLSLSIAEWSWLWFCGIFAVAAWQFFRAPRL